MQPNTGGVGVGYPRNGKLQAPTKLSPVLSIRTARLPRSPLQILCLTISIFSGLFFFGGHMPRARAKPPPSTEVVLPPEVAKFLGTSAQPHSPFDVPRIIEAIEVIGNRQTQRSVILAQLRFSAGDIVQEPLINASRIRLLSTGFFRNVQFSLRRGSARGLVLLIVDVEERNTLRIEDFSFGFGKDTASFVSLGLAETNFLGRGVTLAGAGALGENRRGLEFNFFVPHLSDTPLQFSASMAWIAGEETIDPSLGNQSPKLDYERLGGTLGIGFTSGPAQRISLLYRLETINTNRLPNLNPTTLRRAPSVLFDHSVLSTIQLAWEHDTRDDAFAPSRGMRLALAVELGTSVMGSAYEFSKYTGEIEYAREAFRKHFFVVHALSGLIQGETPFFNQFFVRDFSSFSYGYHTLPRALELNFGVANDYDDLLLDIGLEYSLLVHQGIGDWLERVLIYFSSSLTFTGSLREAQEDIGGRDTFDIFPIYIDSGVKLDTSFGRFTFSLAYALDLFL
ncbi:MAG: BamA/TamA family outer membrane protein [Myxococcales bacterium]|nr:BamA/TamA family outer membrane protein [Myxococcales bacterium]